jgi:hypothetical protein
VGELPSVFRVVGIQAKDSLVVSVVTCVTIIIRVLILRGGWSPTAPLG